MLAVNAGQILVCFAQSQYKGNHKGGRPKAAPPFVVPAKGLHLCIGSEQSTCPSSLNAAHVLRLNKADVLALNMAHVLRLNS